jgi:hypothetical protein
VNLIVHQVMPAIAAGCPFVVKPSADTPLSCFRVVALLHEAGLPPEWGQALLAEREVAELLVTDSRVAFFSFVGSARVGWALRSKLAPGARCALEHGGAAPVIVAADADLDRALPALVKGGFYHAGQVCVSVQRVFVHRSIAAAVSAGLAQGAAKMKVGDPALPGTEVGPAHPSRRGEARRRMGRGGVFPRRAHRLGRPRPRRQPVRSNGALRPSRRLPREPRRGLRAGRLRLSVRRRRRGDPGARTHCPTHSRPRCSRATSRRPSTPIAISTPLR